MKLYVVLDQNCFFYSFMENLDVDLFFDPLRNSEVYRDNVFKQATDIFQNFIEGCEGQDNVKKYQPLLLIFSPRNLLTFLIFIFFDKQN